MHHLVVGGHICLFVTTHQSELIPVHMADRVEDDDITVVGEYFREHLIILNDGISNVVMGD